MHGLSKPKNYFSIRSIFLFFLIGQVFDHEDVLQDVSIGLPSSVSDNYSVHGCSRVGLVATILFWE